MTGKIIDTYPLSPMQEGMLFNSLIAPHSGIDIEQIVFVLREELRPGVFQDAWDAEVKRHAVLRTSFRLDASGRPVQDVYGSMPLRITQEDWSACSPSAVQANLQSYLRDDRRQGFDPERPPLMRVRLFTVSESEYYAVWTFHHALLDGRSFPILIKEIFGFYEALCEGKTFVPEEIPPYRTFIDWIAGRDDAAGGAFWREYMRGFSAPTELLRESGLPADLPPGDELHEIETALSADVTRALCALAGREGVTPNTFVQGAWALLMGRYGGTDDVVFGATRACRHSTVPEAERMVGLFINTLPVRAKIPPGMHLLPWLKELRATQSALRDFEHTPLVLVQRWSGVPAGQPLFRSLVVFDSTRLNSFLRSQGGRWLDREFHEFSKTNYPLTLAAYLGDRLALRIVYDHSRFTEQTIIRMGGHLSALLDEMVTDPQRPLSGYSMLTAAERTTLRAGWNRAEVPYPRDRCLHELIDEQAGRTPDAAAVEFEGTRLSYSGLARRSNMLSRTLASLGVGPEVLVGVCMDRSPEMVVGILAVLKAGGAYVPLNPADPAERLARVVRETAMPVLLTQKGLVSRLPSVSAAVLCLDEPVPPPAAGMEGSPPPSGVSPENAAYVIYTSGSTGAPKGVVVIHKGLVNYVSWAARAYGISPGEASPVHTSLTFDLTLTSLFVPLVAGGTVLLLREDTGLRRLNAALQDTGKFGLVKITPAHLDILSVQIPREAMAGCARTFVVGGEDLRGGSIAPWQASAPDTMFVNEYGPTEATVGCCTFSIPPAWRGSGSVPIGQPIANTQLYILDPWLNPVPALVPGELYIGGDCLAREYLGRQDLTSERFIENPLTDAPRGRLFRTGDRARWTPEGTIEYLGRLDRQIKIRGYRVEPGEIETVLCRYPGIAEAVVLAREDAPGDRRLVAYCRGAVGSTPEAAGIIPFCQAHLPSYCIPSAVMMLDRIPLTPNGKVDYAVLPVPVPSAGYRTGGEPSGPATATENAIAQIWCEVLNLKQVGVGDNFFEIGGHSLLATRIVSRVRSVWKVEMPFASIFDHPTVSGMALVLERMLTDEVANMADEHDVSGDAILPSATN